MPGNNDLDYASDMDYGKDLEEILVMRRSALNTITWKL